MGEAKHLGVLTLKRATGSVLLGIVEGKTPLHVQLGNAQLAEEEQGLPQHLVSSRQVHGVPDALDQ
jgi:hypothetical protein